MKSQRTSLILLIVNWMDMNGFARKDENKYLQIIYTQSEHIFKQISFNK